MDLRAKITDAVYDHPRADDITGAVIGAVENEIAARIVADEQKCQEAINADPTNPHLAGKLAGLQRARDIVLARDIAKEEQ